MTRSATTAADSSGSYIGEARAKQIVEQRAGTTGTYREFKLERDDGRMVYEGELRSGSDRIRFHHRRLHWNDSGVGDGPLSSQLRSTRDRFPDQAFVPQTAGGHVKYDLTDEKSCDTLQILSRGEQELYD